MLEHPWLKEGGEASDKLPDSAVLIRMKRFRAMNQMKKLALKDILFLLHVCFQADIDQSKTIDYFEFIAATMDRHKVEKEESLFKAFQYFDKDNNGLLFSSLDRSSIYTA
ncbi:Calcium-dependent protein kinase 2 [Glycine soja]